MWSKHILIMPLCTMHRRHTVVRLFVGSSVRQILHIFVSGEFQVLKVGQYAKNDIVSAHRRILGMASVVCVLVKICVSSISLYKLDTDKLTAPFESAHQFTLVCTVSDSKTVPGCHYNLCSNHSFVLAD